MPAIAAGRQRYRNTEHHPPNRAVGVACERPRLHRHGLAIENRLSGGGPARQLAGIGKRPATVATGNRAGLKIVNRTSSAPAAGHQCQPGKRREKPPRDRLVPERTRPQGGWRQGVCSLSHRLFSLVWRQRGLDRPCMDLRTPEGRIIADFPGANI